jgi:hypothetical protein
MKTPLLNLALLLTLSSSAQITTPAVKAGFGVDADLRSNFYNGFIQAGNDDWFSNGVPGPGSYIIDTTGAAAMMAQYAINPASRKLPFYRTMRLPQFSIVNNRLWIDAVYIRDYNGAAGGDSTAFVTSNKNGDSPGAWDGGITSVLDKNDIAEMMIHVRRAGPTKTDSLWFMGGLSLQGTTGNRYFDFELYQTDIFYSRSTGAFSNYGPDAGHTSWKFDAAGNVIKPGDAIFTAEYSSSSLTAIEARIWINKNDLAITPAGFSWSGAFDGASTNAQYGYAGIKPKTAGTYYTGLQSGNNTWAGPFGFIDGGNNLQTTYAARQYMEFSVNLSKLGLDPITLLGGNACGLPFRRILVKTRSSTSFSSELKDFIGPFDFFSAQPVQAMADIPIYCGVIGVSNLFVTNPASASVYTWSTTNGHIVNSNVGSSITVDAPGTYIVTQQLLDGCSSFAYDTVQVAYDATCVPMQSSIESFRVDLKGDNALLNWLVKPDQQIEFFDVQRSLNGKDFIELQRIPGVPEAQGDQPYSYTDRITELKSPFVFYRLRMRAPSGLITYSSIASLSLPQNQKETILFPNPVNDLLQLSIPSDRRKEARLTVVDISGRPLKMMPVYLKEGSNLVRLDAATWRSGTYLIGIETDSKTIWKKFIVNHSGTGY